MLSKAFSAPQPSRGDRAKARLLEAALPVFAEQGPKGATVRAIAAAAGQNIAAIAYHFGGKKKLYNAVIEGLVRELHFRLGDIVQEIERLRRQERPDVSRALRLLKDFLGAVYLRLLSRKEAVHIARLIVREQLSPTAGFEILYEKGFRQLHESLCFLVGVVLGASPEHREIILRTHLLMGQVYFFAMSREAILRRLGWTTLEGKNAQLVVALLEEHIETLLFGLSKQRATPQTEPSTPGGSAA